jgi:hypothetical protein
MLLVLTLVRLMNTCTCDHNEYDFYGLNRIEVEYYIKLQPQLQGFFDIGS